MNVNPEEVKHFSEHADSWWDLNGFAKPLHVMNKPRLAYILKHTPPQNDIRVLDVGCGGGILSESMARRGFSVTGIDASPELISKAKEHAINQNINIDYSCVLLEGFLAQNRQNFDIVTCMELIEHVPNPTDLIRDLSKCLKPGGTLYLSTINRNLYAYIGAILLAEYILKLLPKETHHYEQLVTLSEMAKYLRQSGLHLDDARGIFYNPLTHTASLIKSTKVNYIVKATLGDV